MRQTEVREPAEEPGSTFDLVFVNRFLTKPHFPGRQTIVRQRLQNIYNDSNNYSYDCDSTAFYVAIVRMQSLFHAILSRFHFVWYRGMNCRLSNLEKKEEKRRWYMNAIRVTIPRHNCVHEVNGHSSNVDYKSMFYITCRYIFDYVLHQQREPWYASVPYYRSLRATVSYHLTTKKWFDSVKIFSFENHWLFSYVFQDRQLSDEATYERGEPSTSSTLVQGKFVNCRKNISCLEK